MSLTTFWILRKQGRIHFKGFVRGANLYNVIIRINDELEIISTSCDCPYDYGRYCKHQVALMYMIIDLEAFHSNYQLTGNVEVVENIIGKMKKSELVDLVRNICIVDRTSLNRVLIELGIDDDIFEDAIRYYE